MDKNDGYPKYQISKFHGNSRNLQSVFRTDSKEEYLETLKLWSTEVEATAKVESWDKPKDHGTCPKCGAEMVLNPRTNKVFCKEKCWLKNEY